MMKKVLAFKSYRQIDPRAKMRKGTETPMSCQMEKDIGLKNLLKQIAARTVPIWKRGLNQGFFAKDGPMGKALFFCALTALKFSKKVNEL